ncbi:LppX_LprAFG lipoprotein [Mycobacterium sp. 852002-40037_SCH5390672]|uniref:LppX_LprAFG lipoprotein n=1 Tax=Mycobacterium sp. 852002-40037_SCH5390672 TaxID=1834089 RepID=UPI0009EF6658|nr:LppX_LprAFG lipoprotein [Mycobacterium sp. 852002-40037_SCH5390672]
MTLVCLIFGVPLLAGGCSQHAGSAPSPSASRGDSGAERLVRSSAEATRKLVSAHVAVVVKGKFDRLGPVTNVDADVQANPLIANGQITYSNGTSAPFGLADGKLSVMQGSEWTEVGSTSAFLPPSVIDPSQGLPLILDSIVGLQMQGTDTVDGIPTQKVSGTVPADRLKKYFPEATGAADFTAWIQDSANPVLVRTAGTLSAQQGLTVTLSKWNVPVSVTAPPSS